MYVSAILVAAGKSERMGGIDKLELIIDGYSVLEQSILKLANNILISEIVIVVASEKEVSVKENIKKLNLKIPYTVTVGGDTRLSSVKKGLAASSPKADFYCIHDAARPFASDKLITDTINAAFNFGAAASGNTLSDTVKELNSDDFVKSTLDRNTLRTIGTPQVFSSKIYIKALNSFEKESVFDDCEIVEQLGVPVKIIEGERSNIKITTRDDIRNMNSQSSRIGHGYDVHRLTDGEELILGGARIPFEKKLLGHSDADVIVHAIIDALLGAAALGDIGGVFPDTDPRYKGISSLLLLSEIVEILKKERYEVVNIDATIICQKPKLSEYIEQMRENISGTLGIPLDRLSIKATTEEGLGFSGEMLGIAAHAVAQINRM